MIPRAVNGCQFTPETREAKKAVHKYFIGVDEAGYGPNLGPLVVASSLWRAPAASDEAQFLGRMQAGFAPRLWTPGCAHVPLGDSKLLYQPGAGIASLEAGLLALLAQCDDAPTSVGALWRRVVAPGSRRETIEGFEECPWYAGLAHLNIPG